MHYQSLEDFKEKIILGCLGFVKSWMQTSLNHDNTSYIYQITKTGQVHKTASLNSLKSSFQYYLIYNGYFTKGVKDARNIGAW